MDGFITACNQSFAAMFGFQKEHLIGRVQMTSFGCEGMQAAIRECLSGNSGLHEGSHQLEGSGKVLIVKADFRPITAEDGSISGCIGIVRDITERKLAEQAQQASERQLRLLSSRLLLAQEEERKRIAGELHDSIGSSLNAIQAGLRNTLEAVGHATVQESVESSLSMVQHTIDEVRRIMTDLRPSMLDDLGLIATVGWFCRQFQSIYSSIGIERTISVDEEEIPDPLKIVIFRILQEALNNITKYSKADCVKISLLKEDDGMELTIADNGVGFELESLKLRKDYKGCLGLNSMRERTELSGGIFSIESGVGRGTVIRASWKGEAPG